MKTPVYLSYEDFCVLLYIVGMRMQCIDPPPPTTQTATGEKNGHIGMATPLVGVCKQKKMQEGWEEKPFDQIQACL